jgi:hypothetical protein
VGAGNGVRLTVLVEVPAKIVPRLRHPWADIRRAVLELNVDVAGHLDENNDELGELVVQARAQPAPL